MAGSGRAWSITATRGYFAAATYTLLMPDMSAAGYEALWALQVGAMGNSQYLGVRVLRQRLHAARG